MVGGVAAGPALGRTIELFEVRMVPVVLFVLAAICLAATWWLTGATGKASGRSATGSSS